MNASPSGNHSTATPEFRPVAVARRIEADAATIFGVLTDPRRHTDMTNTLERLDKLCTEATEHS